MTLSPLAACTGASTPPAGGPTSGTSSVPTSAAAGTTAGTDTGTASAPDPQLVARVRAVFDRLSAAAAGAPAAQQQLFLQVVDPGQLSVQRRCVVPTGTLTFEPAYAYLAAAPDWQPAQGTMTGTVYSLPSLLRVHRQGRIAGTDLADLHISVSGDTVRLTALCAA
ncbi:hypothetical protein [Nakamurella endophytica]|uniref:hypothetical protein n=1 Tax=Nakamurella endophytica TaxID=1748367 RepID=UPI0016645EC2|nr:hypothetical protein [Nakamurella endophytica]